MDGVGDTYERIRKKSFIDFLRIVGSVGESNKFGINYVVNELTVHELKRASKIVEELGASDLLLLPEVGFGRGKDVSADVLRELMTWVKKYKGTLKLSVSTNYSKYFDIVNPFEAESSIESYMHVDAFGNLKKSSFDLKGIKIEDSIMSAIRSFS